MQASYYQMEWVMENQQCKSTKMVMVSSLATVQLMVCTAMEMVCIFREAQTIDLAMHLRLGSVCRSTFGCLRLCLYSSWVRGGHFLISQVMYFRMKQAEAWKTNACRGLRSGITLFRCSSCVFLGIFALCLWRNMLPKVYSSRRPFYRSGWLQWCKYTLVHVPRH